MKNCFNCFKEYINEIFAVFSKRTHKTSRQTLWDIVVDVSKAQLIEPASTGGLRACFFIENLTKHASASYDF